MPEPRRLRPRGERRRRGAELACTPSAGDMTIVLRLYSRPSRVRLFRKNNNVTTAVAIKLLAVLLAALIGYGAGRYRLLTHGAAGSDAARVLSNAALYVFVPALLFRTTAR